jgi:hypothetical protein
MNGILGRSFKLVMIMILLSKFNGGLSSNVFHVITPVGFPWSPNYDVM